jgi:hypothetical protein
VRLTLSEFERGWVEFSCPDHGFLVATSAGASVTCRCKKRAFESRNGRKLGRQEMRRITASAKALQNEGSDFTIRPVSAKSRQEGESPSPSPERSL